MAKRRISTLVLASSLLLALPPSWCCILVCAAAPAAKAAPVAKKSCCMHDSQEQQTPAEKPSVPSNRCPCCDRLSVLVPYSSGPQIDAGFNFVAVLAPLAPTVTAGAEFRPFALSMHPPACQVHVCNCVWLC